MIGHRVQGKRFKKKPGDNSVRLSRDDIEFLKRNTRYSEKEIKEWFSGFIDVCPSGEIDRQSIADIYAMPKRNADKFIDQMFKMFDQDGDGNISFRVWREGRVGDKISICQEFVLATNLTTAGSAEDKLKWAFKLYDKGSCHRGGNIFIYFCKINETLVY